MIKRRKPVSKRFSSKRTLQGRPFDRIGLLGGTRPLRDAPEAHAVNAKNALYSAREAMNKGRCDDLFDAMYWIGFSDAEGRNITDQTAKGDFYREHSKITQGVEDKVRRKKCLFR